ncbi:MULTISPECIES: pitrilysin family protein [unclassified Methylobacterium]|uniref:M16 family metallopeptidase n=1 Tax=unclassified Methylobacterium TaxID=2615210 RepID=UPI0006F59BCD|nr:MULTISPECIES: pitrilysin family protein [unclassified Methylobacterium]KQP61511.1 zinc protease [Methylobacterium sp. Leaf108]KQT80714.1 zinc protease [Methylobacterium sp. Leaf466]
MNAVQVDLADTRSSASQTLALPVPAASGIEAWHVESPVVPLIALSFAFEGGAAQDPEGKAGVAQMLARLLDEGAGDLVSDAFQERLAARAIELSFHAGHDSIGGSLKMLVKHADEAIDLLALALAKPRFDPDAVERVRGQTLAGLRYQQNDPGVMASRRFFREGFAGHPYSRPSSGTPESVAAITRDDLVAMHRHLIGRGGIKVAAVGAIDAARLADALNRAFGVLDETAPLEAVPQTVVQDLGRRVVVDLDVPQSVIRFGMGGVAWRDPDFIPAYVFNHIFGGGSFTSRLFQEVREKRGLAYSVGTSLVSHRASAITWGYTATKNERVGEAMTVISEELNRLIAEGPSDEELQKAKDYLTGSYALGFDTSTKIAHQLVQIAFEGLGMDYIARRNTLVADVTQADIRRAAARTVADGRMLVVAAGRPTDF